MTSNENAVIEKAQELRWSDRVGDAISLLREFVMGEPRGLKAKLLLASLYADGYAGGVLEAERLFRDVIEEDPTNVAALSGLALLEGKGSSVSVDESLKLLETVVEFSHEPDALLNLGFKAWSAGRAEEAMIAFSRLLSGPEAQPASFAYKIAKKAVKSIREGKQPSSFTFAYPEIA